MNTKKPHKRKAKQVSVSLPARLRDRLTATANEREEIMSRIIQRALEDYLDKLDSAKHSSGQALKQ